MKKKPVLFSRFSIALIVWIGIQVASARADEKNTLTPPIDVPLVVKEVAGVGANGYPVHAVVPLPYGFFQLADNLCVVDKSGNTVPAQFEVLNRWWGRDNSIRHVVVHFQPRVGAFTGIGTGIAKYRLKNNCPNPAPPAAVTVNDEASRVVIHTGATTLTITKAPDFSIRTAGGELHSEFEFWDRVKQRFVLQKSFERRDIAVEIEEDGPMRAVVKISAPTIFNAVDDHLHGWALRLYAYAGKPYVKLDFQLQNSAKNAVIAAPMYFKSMRLVVDTGKPATPLQVRSVVVRKPEDLNRRGMIATRNLQAMIRNFTHRWPNGLAVDAQGRVAIELWPAWGEKYYWDRGADGMQPPVRKEADKYWLDDMQHAYKEVLLYFGPLSAKGLKRLAEIFQYPPVVSLPSSWYQETAVTLNMGGNLPLGTSGRIERYRKPDYRLQQYFNLEDDGKYLFGWNVFAAHVARKNRTAGAGGVPDRGYAFLVTGNPADYYRAQDYAVGELNMRPHWLAGYRYETDWAALKLSANPYNGRSWRRYHPDKPDLAADYLPGSKQHARPRDDQHAWYYAIEDAYYLSANPWIKDWYEFVGEFRKTFLNQKDLYPDSSSRGHGHALNHALQAYRATGDRQILEMASHYIGTTLIPQLHPLTRVRTNGNNNAEGGFMLGYLSHALIDLYIELGGDKRILDILKGFMEWNVKVCNFCYHIDSTTWHPRDKKNSNGEWQGRVAKGKGISSGTAMTLVEPQLWVGLKLNRPDMINHLKAYVTTGINGGGTPFLKKQLEQWDGKTYSGAMYTRFLQSGEVTLMPSRPQSIRHATKALESPQ